MHNFHKVVQQKFENLLLTLFFKYTTSRYDGTFHITVKLRMGGKIQSWLNVQQF